MRRTISTVLTALLAGASGAAIATLVGASSDQPVAAAPQNSAPRDRATPSGLGLKVRGRLNAVERRVSMLESERLEEAPREEPTDEDDGQLDDEEVGAEAVPTVWEEAEQTQATFEAEARDPAWAGPAEASFTNDLSNLRDASFAVETVECRGTLCRAELGWDSLEARDADVARVAHQATAINCATSVFSSAEYHGTGSHPIVGFAYYDCAERTD